ncbi:MAG: aminopeptidase P family protein [Candidatus Aenigmarchaeota archaeon]|nr:aminopeptidase P family protein [Candidatus Aenigmarchaeota archaeon]
MEAGLRLGRAETLSEKVDAILLFSGEYNPNYFYFTNSPVSSSFFLYDFSSASVITNAMEFGRAKKGWVKPSLNVDVKALLEGKKVGIDFKHSGAIVSQFPGAVDISGDLEKIRAVKTDYEIARITKACRISGRVWKYAEREFSRSLKETEMKALIESKMLSLGVERSFPTIVASGRNSRFPHHVPLPVKMTLPVVIDFGVVFSGYCSDVTRTIGGTGRLEEILSELYAFMEEGMAARKAEEFVRAKLGSEANHFIHSLGHGIGLEVHESPSLSMKSDSVLERNMVFTIEPGIYGKTGARIENDFVFRGKLKNLTQF